MNGSKDFTHAEHNEKTCRRLLETATNDVADIAWIITTAYYAALHFVQAGLFPLKIVDVEGDHNVEFERFEDYFKVHPGFSNHELTARLVDDHFSIIGPTYRHLMSMCIASLNPGFRLSLQDAARAVRELEEIRNFIMIGQAIDDSKLVVPGALTIGKSGVLEPPATTSNLDTGGTTE